MKKENNLVLTTEQHVEMTTQLAEMLADMYGLDEPLETVVDEHGNESYTKDSQERFNLFNDDAEEILFSLGFTSNADVENVFHSFGLTLEGENHNA
tara:strand:+ start:45 stop:332 length:288 start_codon:yes stop_codon:yes gene_type:complete